MLREIFEYSKLNSEFEVFSQRGNAYELKQGQENLYYRMCTSDKSFRVGFQKYHHSDTIYLSIAVSKEKNVPAVLSAPNTLPELSNKKLQNCKDRTGKTIIKSWEMPVKAESVEQLFTLQESLLTYFESQI